MKQALVTGGAGFIGSHLVQALAAQGVAVRVMDNLSSGREENLAAIDGDITLIRRDIRDAGACRDACQGMDAVFHLAALVSVPQSVADPIEADAINIGGTLNLLMAARDNGVRRFVFSSSSAVYGDTAALPTDERALPCPTSPYGVQKLTIEHYAYSFAQLFGMEAIALRYFNVFGPRQNPHSAYAAVVPKFLTRLLTDQAPVVFGDGEQTRDFCFVGDVVQANLLAAHTTNARAFGGAFNIASGVSTSLNALLRRMYGLVPGAPPTRHEPARPGDILHSGANIQKAKQVLNFDPHYDLAAGLNETISFYRRQIATGPVRHQQEPATRAPLAVAP